MKKLLILSFIMLSLFIIYLTTLDKKVYFVALGDGFAMGKSNDSFGKGYNGYIKDYLSNKKVLERYVDDFSLEDGRVTDLINEIDDNVKIDDKTIKNALIKADLLTLCVGQNDIYYKINVDSFNEDVMYEYADEVLKDMDDLFDLVKSYCKEDVIVLGVNNIYDSLNDDKINSLFDYVNKKISKLCVKYGYSYVDIDSILNKDSFDKMFDYYPNDKGYKDISFEIIKKINNSLLK